MHAISPFAAGDAARWRELFGAYNTFYNTQLSKDVYRATWSRITTANGPQFGLAARDTDGRPIGFAHYLFHPTSWSMTDDCYLEDLFVMPEARGSGVGRALIEAVASAARDHGCERLYWLTHESNVAARSLYDRVATNLGFIHYAVRL